MSIDKASKQAIYDEWYNDSKNWKAKFIYSNPKDKRILVPKKFGIGWTFNLGNPMAILLLVVFIGVPMVIFLAGIF